MSSRWSGAFALQFFGHGRNSGNSALPHSQSVWDWTSAQGLEAPAEEKENVLSRLVMKELSAISKAQKLLFLVSWLFPCSQEAAAIRCCSLVQYYLHQ